MKRPHFTDDDSEFSRAGHYRGIVDIDYDGKNRPYRRSRGIMDMDDQSYQQVENDDRVDDFWQDMMFDRHGYGSGIREIETLSTDKQNEELRNKSQQRSPTGSHDKKKSTKASNPVQIDGHSERTPLNQDKMVLAGEECPHLNTQKPRTPSALSDLHDASSVLHVPVPEMPREFSSKAQEVNMIDYTVLNESQLEAVQSTEGYYRVVASAGSGKTRALAYRYAFLVDEIGIPPQNIACVTFTNKAANEMRERIRSMLGDIDAQYICTFHGLGVKILHEDIKSIGWPTAFRIMDDDDMTALLRRVCKKLGCHTQPNMMDLKSFISFNKTKKDPTTNKHYLYIEELMKKPRVVSRSSNSFVSNEEIYKAYLNEQIRSACLDFNDLICIPLYLFSHHPEIKDKWAKRFEYVMVDEFQDVSGGNYDFCESISSVHKNLFVVGDPDQLIYSWRGADMKYIMRFEEMHPGAKTIMLNKNYRCSGRIIDVANQLINSNRNRLKKSMIAHKPQMEQVQYIHCKHPDDAATFVAEEVYALHKQGVPYQNIAILYRAHYVSGPYEQQLIRREIPYIVCSGVPFYQRKEIKDAIAYMGLINNLNPLDFARAVSAPARGISDDEIESIVSEAEASGESLLSITRKKHGRNQRVMSFVDIIERYSSEKDTMSVSDLFADVFTECGLESEYKEKEDDERYDNIMTLKNQILDMEKSSHRRLTLQAFMDEIGTFTGADTTTQKNKISLMTVHGAKGLEFPYVFCVGMNEGIFPNYRCKDPQTMEEERRLAYVAFTRAMDKLYIVEAQFSGYNGNSVYPSRFIFNGGLEKYYMKTPLEQEFISGALTYIATAERSIGINPQSADDGVQTASWRIGSCVVHSIFGKGVITGIQNDIVTVKFEATGAVRTIRKDKLTIA